MYLYHASQHKTLTELKPQPTKSSNRYIGDFVFATKSYLLALMYLSPKGIVTLMDIDDEPSIVICTSVDAFKEEDKGGAVYTLPVDSFSETPQEGLSNYEMVSTQPVQPLKKDVYESTLTALYEAGINIKFTDVPPDSFIGTNSQQEFISQLPNYQP